MKSFKNKLLFGAIYTLIYFFLAIQNVGPEAKGPVVFLSPLVPWPFFLVALALLGNMKDLSRRIFFIGIMILHYAITGLFVYAFTAGFDLAASRVLLEWQFAPGSMIFTAGVYLAGQVMLWTAFATEARTTKSITD